MPSRENYVEVTLKPIGAPANQIGSKNTIIVLVPRSEIESHRAEHQAGEAIVDELIAQALAEERVADISGRGAGVGEANLVESSKFLSERPRIIKDRPADYDREGFKGWIV
jgi:hypothetical protein